MDAIATITEAMQAAPDCSYATQARLIVTALEGAGFAVVPRQATEDMIAAAPQTVCRLADIWSEMVKAGVAETN